MQPEQLLAMIEQHPKVVVYAYAPMCGTCQLASKMLDVVEKVGTAYEWARINLNYYEGFAETYSIESVPCLLIFHKGQLMEKVYAFQSVPHIYEKLNQY